MKKTTLLFQSAHLPKVKSLLFCICFIANLLMSISVKCQAPQAIPYQAIARDASGNVLANQVISIRLAIRDYSSTGNVVFQESHTITTNNLGMFTTFIGGGVAEVGTLSNIVWGFGLKYLQVEMDATGGTNYTNMGTQLLASVPYALSSGDNQWVKSNNNITNLNNTGNVGIGISNPTNKLEVNGSLGIISNNALEFGVLDGSKEVNAGKLGYKMFSPDAFDFIGAGTTGNNRKIKLWAEGGTKMTGNVEVAKNLSVKSLTGNSKRVLFIDDYGNLTTSHSTPTTFNSTINNVILPNTFCGGITNTITASSLPTNLTGANISVKVNLNAIYTSEVIINLISPSGQKINLFNVNSSYYGFNAPLIDMIFTDKANDKPQFQDNANYTGAYQPNGNYYPGCGSACPVSSLSSFGTGNFNGVWTLQVASQISSNAATLLNWSISFDEPNSGTTATTFLQGINSGGLSGGITNSILKYASATSATNSIIFDNGTNIGIGNSNPNTKFHLSGKMKIDSTFSLEFGGGMFGKQADAGKIGYRMFSTDALDIVGAGTSSTNRKIKLWNEGGVSLTGNVSFTNAADHIISIDDVNVAATIGKDLTLRAGNSINTSGGATTGGDLILQAGNGYNLGLPGAGGGDVIIRSGSNSTTANANISNGGNISLQTGGAVNNTISRIEILETGKVGISTTAPISGLDVNTDFKLGQNGSALNSVIKTSITVASNNVIPSNSQVILTYAVPNTNTSSVVMASPAAAFLLGIGILYARVSSPGTVEICFKNFNVGTPTLASGTVINLAIIQ
jgi:subtilisin-like proprotein convertase family protein